MCDTVDGVVAGMKAWSQLFIQPRVCVRSQAYGPSGISIAPAFLTAAAVTAPLAGWWLLGPKSPKRIIAWPTIAIMKATTIGTKRLCRMVVELCCLTPIRWGALQDSTITGVHKFGRAAQSGDGRSIGGRGNMKK
jgi:hypothetical protein